MNRKPLRHKVFDRDGGVCAVCGCNTEAVIEKYRIQNDETKVNAIAATLWDWGVSPKLKTLWHNDHIIPLAVGGKDVVENCQTLCAVCHRNKTSKTDVPLITKINRKRKKAEAHRRKMRDK